MVEAVPGRARQPRGLIDRSYRAEPMMSYPPMRLCVYPRPATTDQHASSDRTCTARAPVSVTSLWAVHVYT